jgi:Non-histone chromosomal protein MC1
MLRERGIKKVHVFEGQRVQVDKPNGAPAWVTDKIWKPIVKNVGIETLIEI